MVETARRFGDYDVLPLVDGLFEVKADMLVHAGGEQSRERMLADWNRSSQHVDVNCFVLRGPGGITLIDSGCGTSWGPAFGHARAGLAALGIEPGQVDRVLLTHLHLDHALGLVQDEAAWLPAAEILVPKADLDHFSDEAIREATPKRHRSTFDITATLRRVYGERLRGFDDPAVLPDITAIPLHGHSPGHTGYLLHDLLIWGDMLHLGDLQPPDPDIGFMFDADPVAAAAARRAGLARAADDGLVVAGGHISGFNRVEREGDAFRVVPA